MATSQLQLPYFDDLMSGLLDAHEFVTSMKMAMRVAVEQSGMSREQIVDRMNAIVRIADKGLCKGSRFITLSVFEKWLGDEKRGELPNLYGFHILILATSKNTHPFRVWLQMYGCDVLTTEGKKKLELAELEITRSATEKRRRKLKAELMEGK